MPTIEAGQIPQATDRARFKRRGFRCHPVANQKNRTKRAVMALAVLVGTLAINGVFTEVMQAKASTPLTAATSSAVEAPLTPIVMQEIYPPSAFTGSDGRRHLDYELLLTNASPRSASITGLTVRSGSRTGLVLQVLDEKGVMANMWLLGNGLQTRTNELPSSSVGQVALDTVLPASTRAPSRLFLTLSQTFGALPPGLPSAASAFFPTPVTEQLPPVAVSTVPPIIVNEPVAGGDWVSVNACCAINAHHGALLGAAGTPVSGERYAIDFIRIDSQAEASKPGSPPALSNNYSYGANLLAVADGTVVSAQTGLPDQPVGALPTGLTLDQFAGNDVVEQIRPHVYAFYAHIVPGTTRVHPGERVRTGEVLGKLGNSGNSSAPHLHFQLMDGPGPLTSEGIPYEFRTFKLLAQPTDNGDLGPRQPITALHDVYPLENTVIGFPGGSSAPVKTEPFSPSISSGNDG
jgi:Peptidase family M23